MRKGFTLIETILGLFLLGLISLTIFPMINSSFLRVKRHNIRMEMVYLGEMSIEKIKSYSLNSNPKYIFDTEVQEIIELFKGNRSVEVVIPKEENREKFKLTISKEEYTKNLWKISVLVKHNIENTRVGDVIYHGYLPKK